MGGGGEVLGLMAGKVFRQSWQPCQPCQFCLQTFVKCEKVDGSMNGWMDRHEGWLGEGEWPGREDVKFVGEDDGAVASVRGKAGR